MIKILPFRELNLGDKVEFNQNFYIRLSHQIYVISIKDDDLYHVNLLNLLSGTETK